MIYVVICHNFIDIMLTFWRWWMMYVASPPDLTMDDV